MCCLKLVVGSIVFVVSYVVVCGLSFVVCCLLVFVVVFFVWRLLRSVCCELFVGLRKVCCVLFVVRCLLFVVC